MHLNSCNREVALDLAQSDTWVVIMIGAEFQDSKIQLLIELFDDHSSWSCVTQILDWLFVVTLRVLSRFESSQI